MAQTELEALVFQMDVNLSKMNKKLDKATADTKKTSNVIQGHFDKAGASISGNFTGAIEGAASQVPILGDALISLGGPSLVGVAALAALAVGLNEARAAMDWADTAQATADHIGITVESLQELQFAAGEADVEVADMEEGLKSLNATLGAIQTGVGSAKIEKAFKAIGISPEQLKGMNDASDLLPLLADRIGSLGTQAEKVQIAKKLGIEALLPMLQNGATGLKEVTDRAKDLGLVIDNETTAALADMNREVEISEQRLGVQLKKAFLGLAPAISGTNSLLADFVQHMNDSIEKSSRLVPLFEAMSKYDQKSLREGQRMGLSGDALADYVKRTGSGVSYTDASGNVSVEQMKKAFGIKDAAVAGSGGGAVSASPGSKKASEAMALVKSLMAEDKRLGDQYDEDKKALAAGLKQRQITQAQYDAALAELTRQYNMKSSGAFVVRKDQAAYSEQNEGKITKDTLGTYKDKDIDLIDPLIKLPQVIDPARQALEGLRDIAHDMAGDLGEAIAYGDDLGDTISNSLRRIAASWLSGGLQTIFDSLLGKSGSGSSGILGSVISGIGGGISGARAGGGAVSGAGTYLVGEHGPELFSPGLNGSIVNNNALQRLAMSGGRNQVVKQYFTVNAQGAIMASDIIADIRQTGINAAQMGAYGGAQLARVQTAKRERGQMS